MRKLYKEKNGQEIMGVCNGIADCFNLDVTMIRLITFIIIWFSGYGLLLYILLGLILPNKSEVS